MKFLRIRYSVDETPDKFNPPALDKEWAIPGTFIFSLLDPKNPHHQNILVNAWLGTETFGFARLAEVAEITPNEYQRVINRLAHYLAENGLARDLEDGFGKASDEAEHTAKLANREIDTVMMVDRVMTPHGVSETFKTVPRE